MADIQPLGKLLKNFLILTLHKFLFQFCAGACDQFALPLR